MTRSGWNFGGALEKRIEGSIFLNGCRMKDAKGQEVCTIDGRPGEQADRSLKGNGQQVDYVVLCDSERTKGFVRPYRDKYIHLKCGTATSMGQKLSETYARDPSFYGSTFCANCGEHFPVGADGEFVWDMPFETTPLGKSQKVGT